MSENESKDKEINEEIEHEEMEEGEQEEIEEGENKNKDIISLDEKDEKQLKNQKSKKNRINKNKKINEFDSDNSDIKIDIDYKKYCLFYQEENGDIYYLDPLTMEILLSEYEDYNSLPTEIEGIILDISMNQVTSEFKSKYEY